MKIGRRTWWWIFAAVVLIQLGFLSANIIRWERTLTRGQVFKIRCEPIDPYDPFRGRYVSLNLGRPQVARSGEERFEHFISAFVTLRTGEDGYAEFVSLHRTAPGDGAFIKCQVGWYEPAPPPGKYTVVLPFDRYFLNEKLAPQAEFAFQEALRERDGSEAWIQLRVLNGNAVIEEVFVDGKPIAEAAREAMVKDAGDGWPAR